MSLSKRLAGLFGGRRLDREIQDELSTHIEMRTEQLISTGVPPEEAHRRAQLAFGNSAYMKEDVRSADTVRWLEDFTHDVRHSVRLLWRDTRFGLAAIVTLALGIGATAAAFGVVYCVLLRPLPYPNSDRLVTLWEESQAKGISHSDTSAANFYDWERQNASFDSMTAFSLWPLNLTGTSIPEHLQGAMVSPAFFSVMGVQPLQGRGFRAGEDASNAGDVAVVSEGLWERLFPKGTRLNGQSVRLNGSQTTIVGVMPRDFEYPSPEVEIWVPLSLSAQNRANREGRWLKVIGRVKSGVSLEKAGTDMSLVAHRLAQDYPKENDGRGVRLIPLRTELAGNLKPRLAMLFGAVSLLLFIACSNVGSLLMARALSRRGEMSVRLAIGASRQRVIRQLLTESMVLALLAGALGTLVAYILIRVSRTLIPASVPRIQHLGIDGYVLAFCLGVSLLTVLLFGSIPALRSAKVDLAEALQGSAGTRSTRRSSGRQVLVAAQIAISVILLTTAGLLTKSFAKLLNVNPGFDPRGALIMNLSLPRARYGRDVQQIAFFQSVLERVRTVPGVEQAAAVSDPPLQQNSMTFKLVLDHSTGESPSVPAGVRWVSDDYFQTMRIALLQGRVLDRRDNASAPLAAEINRSMARKYWPNGNAIGSRLRLEEDSRWYEVVGVVDDVKQLGLEADEVPAVYLPHAQKAQPWMNWMSVVVRTSVDPTSELPAIRQQIWSVDREQPIANVQTLEEARSKSIALPRFSSLFAAGFSLLALFITLVGIYGLVSYAVSQRMHEIGIRVALGARPAAVLRLVVGRTVLLTCIGAVAGLLGAAALARSMSTLLFGVSSADPSVFMLTIVGLAAVVVVACYAPAQRALRVDPMRILRYE